MLQSTAPKRLGNKEDSGGEIWIFAEGETIDFVGELGWLLLRTGGSVHGMERESTESDD